MFDNPILEGGSKTPWWLIPIAYIPLEYWIVSNFCDSISFNISCVLSGILFWSFMEYVLHRFVFHGEDYWMAYLPNNRWIYAFHYTIHGIHHCFPMDRYRLVFPPVPGHILFYVGFYLPSKQVMPMEMAFPFLLGNLFGY